MKKISIILIALIVVGSVFVMVNNSKKDAARRAKEVQMQEAIKKQKEVESKLEGLTVSPVIEASKQGSGSTSGSGKTQAEMMDEEDIQMLSFTNARQCSKLILLKDKCRGKFVFALAIKNNDLAYCDSLKDGTEKQDCQDEIHYNLLACNDIQNSTLKRKCEYTTQQTQLIAQRKDIIKNANASSDASLCKTLMSYGEKETCVKNVILKTGNIALCNQISTDKQEQTRCIKNTSYELTRAIISEAYEKKDLSLCDKITDETIRKQCKTMVF